MKRVVSRIEDDQSSVPSVQRPKRLSFFGFLGRYPIFLLAFGPPIFRPNEGVDITKGQIDIWSFMQVGLLFAVAARAILRLVLVRSFHIPKQVRSILIWALGLSILYFSSAIYSPSHFASASYALLYLLSWVCVAEFIANVYWKPPNWIECLFHLRSISLYLLAIVLLTLAVKPALVLIVVEGAGIRLLGNAVAPTALICSMIAIISAYAFLYSLEHKLYSIIFFLVGLAGNLSTQVRGSEIALMVCLLILISGRGRISRRSVYLLITGFVASILMFLIILGTVGGERIWNVFNRGQDSAGISSASGRTEVWAFVLQYCMTHPWGMGYVAGFRIIFRQYFSLSSAQTLSNLGTAHNTFMDALAGAGWLGLMFYLVILIKTLKLGGAVANIKTNMKSTIDSTLIHGVRCSYVLLIYCMVFGLDDTDFSAPLRAAFYYLYIIIAIILGASARMIATYRPQHTLRPNDSLWGVETEFKDII